MFEVFFRCLIQKHCQRSGVFVFEMPVLSSFFPPSSEVQPIPDGFNVSVKSQQEKSVGLSHTLKCSSKLVAHFADNVAFPPSNLLNTVSGKYQDCGIDNATTTRIAQHIKCNNITNIPKFHYNVKKAYLVHLAKPVMKGNMDVVQNPIVLLDE